MPAIQIDDEGKIIACPLTDILHTFEPMSYSRDAVEQTVKRFLYETYGEFGGQCLYALGISNNRTALPFVASCRFYDYLMLLGMDVSHVPALSKQAITKNLIDGLYYYTYLNSDSTDVYCIRI